MKGTWTTSGGGGGDVGLVIAVIAAAVLAVPILTALAALIHALVIAVFAVTGLALTTGAAVLVYRVRHRGTVRALPVHRARVLPPRAAEPLPAPHRPAIGRPAEVHLHFHGVTADDAAAIIRKAGE